MSFQVTIETPAASRQKFNLDPASGAFVLGKSLPLGMVFPFDFGFIPDTKAADGDPIDAMVISEYPTFPGCRINCRLVGMLKAEQKEDGAFYRNDRYFFVPEHSLAYRHITTMADFPEQLRKELLAFFVHYNQAQEKDFNPLAINEAPDALDMLQKLIPAHARPAESAA